jgi:hypothetical protein
VTAARHRRVGHRLKSGIASATANGTLNSAWAGNPSTSDIAVSSTNQSASERTRNGADHDSVAKGPADDLDHEQRPPGHDRSEHHEGEPEVLTECVDVDRVGGPEAESREERARDGTGEDEDQRVGEDESEHHLEPSDPHGAVATARHRFRLAAHRSTG